MNANLGNKIQAGLTTSLSFQLARGEGRAFDPLQLSPQLWLDASDLETIFSTEALLTVPANNDGFGYWKDKSGFGRHCTAAAATVKNSSYAGLRSASFPNGSPADRRILTPVPSGILTQDVYILWNKIGDPSNIFSSEGRLWGTTGAGSFMLFTNRFGHYEANVFGGGQFTSQRIINYTTVPSGVMAIHLRASPNVIGGSYNFGDLQLSAHSRPLAPSGTMQLGSLAVGFYPVYPLGDFLEVLAFDYFLDDTQRAKLKTYWETKWAVSLHPPS
jgi:hypothetical protein